MKAKSLQDLQGIQQRFAHERERLAAQEAARQEHLRRVQAEANLFTRAAGVVQPLASAPRVVLARALPLPVPAQLQLDEQRVLQEALSDEFDTSTLLDVDDAMSFRRPGVGTDVTRKLRRGDWSIQREIDLHGLRRDDARAMRQSRCSSWHLLTKRTRFRIHQLPTPLRVLNAIEFHQSASRAQQFRRNDHRW